MIDGTQNPARGRPGGVGGTAAAGCAPPVIRLRPVLRLSGQMPSSTLLARRRSDLRLNGFAGLLAVSPGDESSLNTQRDFPVLLVRIFTPRTAAHPLVVRYCKCTVSPMTGHVPAFYSAGDPPSRLPPLK
jgi:hypothetical protein